MNVRSRPWGRGLEGTIEGEAVKRASRIFGRLLIRTQKCKSPGAGETPACTHRSIHLAPVKEREIHTRLVRHRADLKPITADALSLWLVDSRGALAGAILVSLPMQ